MGRECCGGTRREEAQDYGKERHYVPSEEMGDYEEYRKKRAAKKKGPLYPLNEECCYGAPPSALPKPLPGYQRRERKPKVYAGYAISSSCDMHKDKLMENEDLSKSRSQVRRRTPSFSKGSSSPRVTPVRRASTLPRERSNSVRGASPAPSLDSYSGRANNWQNSLRGSSLPREDAPPRRKPSSTPIMRRKERSPERSPEPPVRRSLTPEVIDRSRRSLSSDGQSSARSSSGSTDWGYTSYSSFMNGVRTTSNTNSIQSSHRSSSLSKGSSNIRKGSRNDSFLEEDEMYRPGNVSLNGFKSSSLSKASSNTRKVSRNDSFLGEEMYRPGNVSLGGLKAPVINPWDNMGILGLSSKMYSDTSVKQSSFSASSFFRKDSVTSSYAM